MPFPARRLGGESAADAERRTRAMKPVYASVYLSNDDTQYTSLTPLSMTSVPPNSRQFYTVGTSQDSLVLNTLAESSIGIVRPKTSTFGFVVPRAGVYRVQAAMDWISVKTTHTLAIFKNGIVVRHSLGHDSSHQIDNPVQVEYMGPCDTSDVFTFHVSSYSYDDQTGTYNYDHRVTVHDMDGSSSGLGPRNYFSLHNVD